VDKEREMPWQHTDLTVKTGGPRATASPAGYTWGADKRLTFADGVWNNKDLTEAVGNVPIPAPASSPVGYMWDVNKTRHVFYRGSNNLVHELWFNGQWHKNNLTLAAGGAPLASGNPAAYTWAVDATQHVFYRGTDRHMHELWFKTQWSHVDISLASNASPPLVGDVNPSCYTWDVDKSQHVVYRGTDSHIHELWFRANEGKWHHNDLSVASGGAAPLAASNPYGYTWDVDKSQHVVYRGKDNFIHELWLRASEGKWNHTALNGAAAFAGKADRDPFGYSWDVDEGQHVVYRGTDGHIHELLFRN
jgi:hypothetical protein